MGYVREPGRANKIWKRWMRGSAPYGARRRVGRWTWDPSLGCNGCDDCVVPVHSSPLHWALVLLRAVHAASEQWEERLVQHGVRQVRAVTGTDEIAESLIERFQRAGEGG